MSKVKRLIVGFEDGSEECFDDVFDIVLHGNVLEFKYFPDGDEWDLTMAYRDWKFYEISEIDGPDGLAVGESLIEGLTEGEPCAECEEFDAAQADPVAFNTAEIVQLLSEIKCEMREILEILDESQPPGEVRPFIA